MAERLYVSKQNETVRMFKSDFMEFFSRVHPAIPLVLYLPVVGYMLYVSLWQRRLSILAVAALFLLGVLLWTLIEYLIHRYIFHYEPTSRVGKQLHFIVHGVHHDYPNDARRLVMPPSISVPLAFLFYGLFLVIFGGLAPAVFAGLVLGYVCYDMLHYATHHFGM
jgi:4-hydroxysphinganine ceramide fatty acyl 2-hydroxylase